MYPVCLGLQDFVCDPRNTVMRKGETTMGIFDYGVDEDIFLLGRELLLPLT